MVILLALAPVAAFGANSVVMRHEKRVVEFFMARGQLWPRTHSILPVQDGTPEACCCHCLEKGAVNRVECRRSERHTVAISFPESIDGIAGMYC